MAAMNIGAPMVIGSQVLTCSLSVWPLSTRVTRLSCIDEEWGWMAGNMDGSGDTWDSVVAAEVVTSLRIRTLYANSRLVSLHAVVSLLPLHGKLYMANLPSASKFFMHADLLDSLWRSLLLKKPPGKAHSAIRKDWEGHTLRSHRDFGRLSLWFGAKCSWHHANFWVPIVETPLSSSAGLLWIMA